MAALTRTPRTGDVIDVFCDAFHAYPVMQFVVGRDSPDYDTRLSRLIELFVQRRFRQGAPVMGIEDDGVLVAAATMTPPGEPPFGAELLAFADEVWGDLGDAARARYQAYADTTKPFFAASGRHHHLNMLGVRASHAGRGLSRPLLEAVAAIAQQDPDSTGISLTTELPKNLTLYQHFGYEIIAHARVAPELETWGLFRRAAL